MWNLGAIAFASPWVLTALLALPIIWWLLRITPPLPSRQPFPPLRILLSLTTEERAAKSSPWWLILLRNLLIILAIVGLARPLLNPVSELPGNDPILIVIDNGWAAAKNWDKRQSMIGDILQQAGRNNRAVVILSTAKSTSESVPLTLVSPESAVPIAAAVSPQPWPTDRIAAAKRLQQANLTGPMEVIWFADGHGDKAAEILAARLRQIGSVTLVTDKTSNIAKILKPDRGAEVLSDRLRFLATRVDAQNEEHVWVRLSGEGGQILARAQAAFEVGANIATADLIAPVELRNKAVRVEIEGEQSAAATVLLDERWRRRPVGLVVEEAEEGRAQPLLSQYLYIEKALAPFAELHQDNIEELLKNPLSVMIMGDSGELPRNDVDKIEDWIEAGGLLLRFAGPRLARNADSLLPAKLRSGDRSLGGALTWPKPVTLMPFGELSPFHDLPVPKDVQVYRQVLAQPSLDLEQKTWARLSDGTPLVTADKQGKGWLVLIHTSANADWSNLALSGLFVEMLRKITNMAHGVASSSGDLELPPIMTMLADGTLDLPSPKVLPVNAGDIAKTEMGPTHPPGFYGRQDMRVALNLGPRLAIPTRMNNIQDLDDIRTYSGSQENDLTAWFVMAALLLIILDTIITLWLRGSLKKRQPLPAVNLTLTIAIITGLMAVFATPGKIAAQSAEEQAIRATEETRFGYVITNDPQVDEMSKAGLFGLSAILNLRTAVEPEAPVAVDVENDEMVFYPLIYWPVIEQHPRLSNRAIARVKQYMRGGGMIVFDTRDARLANFESGNTRQGPKNRLRILLRRLDVPPLIPVPRRHVLTRAFYLLNHFPGRYPDGTVWVEQKPGGVNDGVSSLIVGANDWAAAWAMDEQGRPLAALVPGGGRQREFAYRFGVNLVLYTLTGNYKSDQVHVPAILERLGQ